MYGLPWIALGTAAFWVAFVFVWRPMRAARREIRFAETRRDFHAQRERLEAKFIQLASANAQPNSPHWADCDFDDDVAYVRNRSTGELSAFVAVTVASDDCKNASIGVDSLIGNLHAGTAVFRFSRDHWETDGRALLNLSPAKAIDFYQNDLEVVYEERAERR
ncbi:MAG: hypothetical protein JXB62_16520 [Pirellulales bacterium]|nr:hypothetical protein [Pirellulales bacterium]